MDLKEVSSLKIEKQKRKTRKTVYSIYSKRFDSKNEALEWKRTVESDFYLVRFIDKKIYLVQDTLNRGRKSIFMFLLASGVSMLTEDFQKNFEVERINTLEKPEDLDEFLNENKFSKKFVI